MKKALSMILALLIVLSLCGSAFAANEQLTVTSETAREGDTIVTRYFFRNAEGTLVYAQDFIIIRAAQRSEMRHSVMMRTEG